MFATLKSWLAPKTAARPVTPRLGLTALEAREVPYATVALAYFEGYYLNITGTSARDEITVVKSAGYTDVHHKSEGDLVFRMDRFPDSLKLSDVFVRGGGGDDSIRNDTALPMSAWGDAGNDAIRVSAGRAWMDGGEGGDTLYGGPQADTLIGGGGADYLFGWGGNDTLRGGDGNDYLAGNDGNDKLYGGAGRDQLYGYAGDDWIDPGLAGGPFAPDVVDGGTGLDLNAQVLTVDGIAMADVVQGGGPTCWVASALASVALREPGCLTNAVRYVGEDCFEVTLYNRDRRLVTQRVTFNGDRVGADMPFSATADVSGATAEFWQVIWQRAYLTSRGISIHTQGGGGTGDVLTALTGRATTWVGNGDPANADLRDSAWDDLKAAVSAGKNVTAVTWSDDVTKADGTMKRSTDLLLGWHWYTVTGWSTDRYGNRYVNLRNPHGNDGGSGYGDDDGRVTVSWTHFRKSMAGFDIN